MGILSALEEGEHPAKRSRYTNDQIAFALRQAESGVPVGEVCRRMGILENTFYRWKRKYAGMGVSATMPPIPNTSSTSASNCTTTSEPA